MILFGGVSPEKWLPTTSEKDFIEHVKQWLDLKNVNSNFVQTAGDQVPRVQSFKESNLWPK